MFVTIAVRNIFRHKRRTILTVLTMTGGFVLAAFSIGWSDGSYAYIIDMFTRNRLGHIQIHKGDYSKNPSLYKTIDTYETIGTKLDMIPQIESWTPRVFTAGLGSVGEKSTAVSIIGVDPHREDRTTGLSQKIIQGEIIPKSFNKEVMLGKGLAEILDAQIDDEIALVTQAADGSMANDRFTVAGVVDSGDPDQDRMDCYLHIAEAQDFLVLDDRCHEIAIVVSAISAIDQTVSSIQHAINDPTVSVEPWQEFAQEFHRAMVADQQGMWIMLFIIMLIVAIGVLNTVLMAVLERTREYGVLKALGTRPYDIIKLVLYEVLVMAIISLGAGVIISLIVNYIFSINGIVLPEAFTYGGMTFERMYTQINMRSLYIPAVTVFCAALMVSIFPAVRAAHVDPAHAMRSH
ncbi:MAG: FtsX-like permease family protein [Elusimicrobia bacterium]|nr:FtsX-like permease family protein [Elusimicrobiota bacterium]MBD3411533.1 FtsX-like permease family protein [Elusimicrobiota bacterium]